MQNKTLLSVHIEKTAGTSLLHFFESVFGRKHVAFYDPLTDSAIRSSDLILSPSNTFVDSLQLKSKPFWPRLKVSYFSMRANKRFLAVIPEDITVIHGHFKADRFDTILKNPLHTIVLREPFMRMHSQFSHWKRAKGRTQWRINIPYDQKMTFEEYAMLPQLRNYQVQALGGKELSSFAIVGVNEELESYANALLQSIFHERTPQMIQTRYSVQKLNHMPHKNKLLENESAFEHTFRQYHKEDQDLYRKAQERTQKTS